VHEEPEDDPEAVSVVIDVEEKNWYKARDQGSIIRPSIVNPSLHPHLTLTWLSSIQIRAATYAQGNETSFELGLGLHNLTGRAEHLTISGEIGSERSTEFNATFEQPKPFDLPITLTSRLAQSLTNNQKTSSYTEMMRGLALGVKSFDGHHSLEYNLGWRRLDADPSGLASKAILAQVDDYVKSAVKYTLQAGNKARAQLINHLHLISSLISPSPS
jgi:outer membrane protein insertion porin family